MRMMGRWLGGMVAVAMLAVVGRAAADPASLGQQPVQVEAPVPPAPPQEDRHQLNQLFQFEATPDVCAAGEAYVSGQGNYFDDFPGAGGLDPFGYSLKGQEVRLQVQGQYGITDQIAVGGYLPFIDNLKSGASTGLGDIGLYAQYKLDRVIDPQVVDVTAQLDVLVPSGDYNGFRDNGQVGVRPLALAYKDFGRHGPGVAGAYGLLGFTAAGRCDLRIGLAGTYEFGPVTGVLELFGVHGFGSARRSGFFTPGVVYRGVDSFEFALGVPLGISNTSPDWGVTFKVTYAFQR